MFVLKLGHHSLEIGFRTGTAKVRSCRQSSLAGLSAVADNQSAGTLTWIKAWKDEFANELMRSGPQMAAYMGKPISIGLRLNAKFWRHRRSGLPASGPHRPNAGCLHIRRVSKHLRLVNLPNTAIARARIPARAAVGPLTQGTRAARGPGFGCRPSAPVGQ